MKYRAYAKINWHLKVFPVDEKGYHKIETIFQSIDLADELQFFGDDDLFLECPDSDIPSGKDNLIIKAALGLKEITGYKKGAKIILKKNIPVQAGLGGGSADAAVTLLALNKLWNLNAGQDMLYNLAKKLGADVAFNLRGGIAAGRGYGEILEFLDFMPEVNFVIVKPDFGISTEWAYGTYDHLLREKEPRVDLSDIIKNLRDGNWKVLENLMKNDLEEVVLPKYPLIREIKEELIKGGAVISLMCGSGSSVFGAFVNEDAARAVFDALKKKYKKVFFVKPVRPMV